MTVVALSNDTVTSTVPEQDGVYCTRSQAAVGALRITSRETVAPRCGTRNKYRIKHASTVQIVIRNDTLATLTITINV
jgi:hypothetical protein